MKSGRGGKRPGAGRPLTRRRFTSLGFDHDIWEAMEGERGEGETVTAQVNRLLRGALGLYDTPPTPPTPPASGETKEQRE